MELLALILSAGAVTTPQSMLNLDPPQRDAHCLVALLAEREPGPLHQAATDHFDARVRQIADPELRELIVISAEESIVSNAQRREIASTCLGFYQVLTTRQKHDTEPSGGASCALGTIRGRVGGAPRTACR